MCKFVLYCEDIVIIMMIWFFKRILLQKDYNFTVDFQKMPSNTIKFCNLNAAIETTNMSHWDENNVHHYAEFSVFHCEISAKNFAEVDLNVSR